MRPPVSSSTAVLLHFVDWQLPDPEVPIAPGVFFARTQGSPVEKLYNRLISSPESAYHPKIGDASHFPTYVRFDHPPILTTMALEDPFSPVDRMCNAITVLLGEPTWGTQVIQSSDEFATATYAQMLYMHGIESEFLFGTGARVVDESSIGELKNVWNTIDSVWHSRLSRSRVVNAIAFFQYAWRADYVEQMCLNVATTIEVLFAPHSAGETTHQIAFNVAHFLGESTEERKEIYRSVKKAYGARSSIIHGGLPDPAKIVAPTVGGFKLCMKIFRKMLVSESTTEAFEDENTRREMFEEFLFNRP